MLDGTRVVATYDVAAAVAMATWSTQRMRAAEPTIDAHGERASRGVLAWAPGAPWEAVDQALRAIQRGRDRLDADEARWLRDAERLKIWRHLGMVSALDYCERVLGLAPRTAKDRLRVARALGSLPMIEEELRAGRLKYSVVRELARVATHATEAAWIEQARDKSFREVEELVAGRRPGDLPGDPPDPELRLSPFTLEVMPRVRGLLLAAIAQVRADARGDLDDNDAAEALARAVLDAGGSDRSDGRAKYQVAISVCPQCDSAEQQVGGYKTALDAPALDRIRCDAIHIGDLAADSPERASQTIPPAVVRFVWHRDGGCCQTPGCRSKRGLEIHHIVHRAERIDHSPSNLTLRCFACHQAHHDGRITIGGTAPDGLTFVRHGAARAQHIGIEAVAPVIDPHGVTAPARAVPLAPVFDEAMRALTGLGFSRAIAREAVTAVQDKVDGKLADVIRAALAHCPRPCG